LRILVSGAGSIGKRHVKNLRTLGMTNLHVCDPIATEEEVGLAVHRDFSEALSIIKPQVVLICGPTKLHLEQALEAAKTGSHLFIEKPLSSSLDGVDELQKEVKARSLHCMVGCNMRFHFGPRTVKKLLDAGTIGSVQEAFVYTGSYLPDWRPAQDYKKSYSADPLHGGAILDCIHEIDLALWYMGNATLASSKKEQANSLGLSVEGTADLDLSHTAGAKSHVHVSFMEKEYARFCEIHGDVGTLYWDIHEKKVQIINHEGLVVEEVLEPASYDLNQMYVDELRYFLDSLDGKEKPMGALEEAVEALKIALEARK
jgi:predicted dehydrogenase